MLIRIKKNQFFIKQGLVRQLKGVFDNLKNQINMVQSKTSDINLYKNELIFH